MHTRGTTCFAGAIVQALVFPRCLIWNVPVLLGSALSNSIRSFSSERVCLANILSTRPNVLFCLFGCELQLQRWVFMLLLDSSWNNKRPLRCSMRDVDTLCQHVLEKARGNQYSVLENAWLEGLSGWLEDRVGYSAKVLH